MSSVAFDLLRGSDGAEDDLCEALTGEHPEADPADGSAVFHQRQCSVFTIIEKNIIKKNGIKDKYYFSK